MINVVTSNITTAADVGVCTSTEGYGYNKTQVLRQRGDTVNGIISINAVFYIEEAELATGGFVLMGTIDESVCRPNGNIHIPIASVVDGAVYADGAGDEFTGVQILSGTSVLITPTGEIYAYVTTVNNPVTLASVDYVIIPVCFSFTNIIETSILVLP
jgi:hypothetical protein